MVDRSRVGELSGQQASGDGAGDGGLAWALWNDGMDVMKNERLELEQPKCCVNTVE